MNKEIPIWLAAGLAIMNPKEVVDTVVYVKDVVETIIEDWVDISQPFIWSAAPFLYPLMAWLWWAKLTQFWLDKLWIKNKILRYPWITAWAYFAATSSVAPYFAAWAWIYYAWKYGWKYGKKATNKIWNWLKTVWSKLNPFSS